MQPPQPTAPKSPNPLPLEPTPSPLHDGGMEARIAKIESHVEYIKRDVADLKSSHTRMADAMASFAKDVNAEFKSVREEMRTDFRWIIGCFAGLLAVMAKGFGWI